MSNAKNTNATETTTTAPVETTPATAPVATKSSSSDGFDWASAGKTAGVFALGAVAGAAGKWAWDRFVG